MSIESRLKRIEDSLIPLSKHFQDSELKSIYVRLTEIEYKLGVKICSAYNQVKRQDYYDVKDYNIKDAYHYYVKLHDHIIKLREFINENT